MNLGIFIPRYHMKLDNLLNGLHLGKKQEVGVMTVIPLLGDDVSVEMGTMEDIEFVCTSGYGEMVVSNTSTKPVITPSGYSIITKQSAQDHGTPFSHLIEADDNYSKISVACCIEQTQPGMINGSSVKDFNLLPLHVRKEHFKQYVLSKRGYSSDDFSRLWSIISNFQQKLVNQSNAHLVYFFTKYMDRLTQFNAEFEVVEKQRGAIILLNNKVMGIEIAPSHKYWKEVWKVLIRDVYGSEVVRLSEANLIGEFEASQELQLDVSKCQSIEEMKLALKQHEESSNDLAMTLLNDVFADGVEDVKDSYPNVVQKNTTDKIHYSLITSPKKSLFGEIYTTDDEQVIYSSIIF